MHNLRFIGFVNLLAKILAGLSNNTCQTWQGGYEIFIGRYNTAVMPLCE